MQWGEALGMLPLGVWPGADVRNVSCSDTKSFSPPSWPPFSAPSMPVQLAQLTPHMRTGPSLGKHSTRPCYWWSTILDPTLSSKRTSSAPDLGGGPRRGGNWGYSYTQRHRRQLAWWVAKFPGTGPLGGWDLKLEQVPCEAWVGGTWDGWASSSSTWTGCRKAEGSEASTHRPTPWALSSYTTILPSMTSFSKLSFLKS